MRLIVHLGDKKTGSTAIQTVLGAKGWRCEKVSLAYPSLGQINHNSLAHAILGQSRVITVEDIANSIRAELSRAPADVAVISAEDFEDVDPETFKSVLEEHFPDFAQDLHLIAYVRPHADRVPSSFAERIKAGHFLEGMEDFYALMRRKQMIDYAPRFLKWRAIFGPAFTLRPMIREILFRQDVVADFLRLALGTEDFSVSDALDANESLSLENLAVVRQLHLRLREGRLKALEYQPALGRALARRMNESDFRTGTKLRIHRALAERVAQDYFEDAVALDQAFLDGTPMQDALKAAPGKAVAEEQSLRLEDHFTPREQFLINVFLDQTCSLIKADPKHLAARLRNEHRLAMGAGHGGGQAGEGLPMRGKRPALAGKGKMRRRGDMAQKPD